jgi:hypothetical protein
MEILLIQDRQPNGGIIGEPSVKKESIGYKIFSPKKKPKVIKTFPKNQEFAEIATLYPLKASYSNDTTRKPYSTALPPHTHIKTRRASI